MKLPPELGKERALWMGFDDPKNWRRNQRGSLYRNFKGNLLMINWVRGGGFKWEVKRGELSRWSTEIFKTEQSAICAIGRELFKFDVFGIR